MNDEPIRVANEARDKSYANYWPGTTDDTSVYGIWCAAWNACEEAARLALTAGSAEPTCVDGAECSVRDGRCKSTGQCQESRSVADSTAPGGATLADMFDELVRIVHDDRLEKGDRLQRIDSRIWAYRRNPAPATAFALVPMKPTAPMLTALWNLKDCDAPAQLDEAYRAMLAASPSPTSSAPAEPDWSGGTGGDASLRVAVESLGWWTETNGEKRVSLSEVLALVDLHALRPRSSADWRWTLVPAEPTELMLVAGLDNGHPARKGTYAWMRKTWDAMLAAAPKAESAPSEQPAGERSSADWRRLTGLWRYGVAVCPPTCTDFYNWLGILDAAIDERTSRVPPEQQREHKGLS